MLVETHPTPESSIARLARDSNMGKRIERQTYNYYTPVRIYVTSLRHPLLHALHKYRFAIARVIFTITW